MIITVIGSLNCMNTFKSIKSFWIKKDPNTIVNIPSYEPTKKLLTIYSDYIKKIGYSDMVIAVPKNTKYDEGGVNSMSYEFGESTTYEMAIANHFHIPVFIFNKLIIDGEEK